MPNAMRHRFRRCAGPTPPRSDLHKLIIAVVDRDMPRTEIWRALYGIASLRRAEGKWVIAVNEDIDPDDTNAVFWAMSYRCKPHRDVEILVECAQTRDQVMKPVPQQGLTAGDAKLLDSELEEDPNEPLNFFEVQNLFAREEGVFLAEDFRRHAVGAAEIAAIGHGNAQIAQRAIAGINWSVLGGKDFHGFGLGAFDGFGLGAFAGFR